MMLLLKKNLNLLPRLTTPPASISTSAQNPPPKSNLITDYLIASCGFSPERAAKSSKPIASLTSTTNPDSVRHFFKHNSFTDAQIGKLISAYPRILCADVNRTLQPNLSSLHKMGFAEPELQQLVVRNPQTLLLRSAASRIVFWKALLNGDMKKLVLALVRNRGLINWNIDKHVLAKIALLKEYGLSDSDIRLIVVSGRGLFLRSSATIEVLLKRAHEMGFRPGSALFVDALSTLSCLGRDQFLARMEFFRSFGWSEGDFLSALRRNPSFSLLAEENLRSKMEFLVKRVGCTQAYIVARPVILNYSMEKRLMPQHYVMHVLKSKNLGGREWDFYSAIAITEEKFADRFILRYKDEVPTLLETYNAACNGEFHYD